MRDNIINHHACSVFGVGCFAAGTKLWTPDGYRAVETLQPGDLVYSRDEHDPHAPIEARVIKQIFTLSTQVLHLTVAGDRLLTAAGGCLTIDAVSRLHRKMIGVKIRFAKGTMFPWPWANVRGPSPTSGARH
ncbi:Hint domain-containing protein [Tuwongella immobilis]|uniref:Hint domain-containing protein n=1 Tax=Tuwongella immobilis TaxID=692036 RepID=UPI0018D9BC32|nr:Hint domain-containing protein [Tuwongella immobilis]